MSRQEELITNDETTGAIDTPGGQTSNKAGLASTAHKPGNTGPDAHEEHVAPVPGAFGNEENREKDQRGQYAPADNAIRKNREK